MSKQNQWIVGVNAVASAIENDADNVREVLVEGGSKNARLTEIEENARRKGIDVRRVTGQALDGRIWARTLPELMARFHLIVPNSRETSMWVEVA